MTNPKFRNIFVISKTVQQKKYKKIEKKRTKRKKMETESKLGRGYRLKLETEFALTLFYHSFVTQKGSPFKCLDTKPYRKVPISSTPTLLPLGQ